MVRRAVTVVRRELWTTELRKRRYWWTHEWLIKVHAVVTLRPYAAIKVRLVRGVID